MKTLGTLALAVFALLLTSSPASALTWTLCDAETTDDAVCDVGGADRYAIVTGYTNLLFDSSASSSANYSCDIFGGTKAVAEGTLTDLSSSGFQMNSVSLSQATEAITFADTPVSIVWIKCNTIADSNSVTITVTGSK